MALTKDLLETLDPNNPYGLQARRMSKFGLAPTTNTITRMSQWDMQNRGMNLQEAAQRAREALDFYDLPGGMPNIFTPDNPMTGPMAGALTSYGRVPANLYKSALTEQDRMKSSEAVSNLAQQLQGIAPEGLPPQYGVIMDAISQNPATFSGMIDLVLNKFGEVDSERRGIEAATQREQTVRSIVNELGFNDLVSTMLLTPEFSDIAMQEIKKQFPDRESQLKIQKLEAEIEKIKADTDKTKADTDYTQTRTVNITKVDDDAAFTKEFRARYQSYLNELRSSNMPTVPMSEAEFAKTQGKEVYDRYNKILNPTRGESTGVPSGSIIQQAENLERQFGDTREAILGTLSDPKMSEEILETLMERYNKQHGTNWDKNTWAEEWAKANKIDTGEKKPWWKIW
jgi:hypothetical protein